MEKHNGTALEIPENECKAFMLQRLQEIAKLPLQNNDYAKVNEEIVELYHKIKEQTRLIAEYESKCSDIQEIVEKIIYKQAFKDGFWLGVKMVKCSTKCSTEF